MSAPSRALLLLTTLASAGMVLHGQAPARGTPRAAATPPPATATVRQVMRGILFPSSNVIFAAQSDDPEKIKKAEDPSVAPNPLESVYGGWEAVANGGMALTESARLLDIPRKCSNGNAAPIQGATWQKGLSQLRAAGRAAYDAAQAKSQDKVLDASDKVTEACSTCHDKYREKTPRCVE
jgi:cytochrome c553